MQAPASAIAARNAGRARHRTLPHASSGAAASGAGDGDSEGKLSRTSPTSQPAAAEVGIRGPSAMVTWVREKVEEYYILLRSPMASNILEAKWRRAQRERRRRAQLRRIQWKCAYVTSCANDFRSIAAGAAYVHGSRRACLPIEEVVSVVTCACLAGIALYWWRKRQRHAALPCPTQVRAALHRKNGFDQAGPL